MILNKFRPWASPITTGLDHRFLRDVVNSLFSIGDEGEPRPSVDSTTWSAALVVPVKKLAVVIRRLGAKNTVSDLG